MTRIEIIMDRTIDDLFIEHLHGELKNVSYTLVRDTLGNGESGPRMGTAVWPEQNSVFIIYTTEENVQEIHRILDKIRREHPNNGLAAFVLPEARELFTSDQ